MSASGFTGFEDGQGFRVRSIRGTQFRIWANTNPKEYLLKGFVMNDNRLKNPDGRNKNIIRRESSSQIIQR